MNKIFKISKFSLVLVAIFVQIGLMLFVYFSNFNQSSKDIEIRLSIDIQTSYEIKNGKIKLKYNITNITDYNNYSGSQNYAVGDSVYVSLFPGYSKNDIANYNSFGKDKPNKTNAFFEGNQIVIKGKISEVISPNSRSNKTYQPEMPKLEVINDNSFNSSSSDFYSSSSFNDYSDNNQFSYDISYNIEDYEISLADLTELKSFRQDISSRDLRAVISINKEGIATFKNLELDGKVWPN